MDICEEVTKRLKQHFSSCSDIFRFIDFAGHDASVEVDNRKVYIFEKQYTAVTDSVSVDEISSTLINNVKVDIDTLYEKAGEGKKVCIAMSLRPVSYMDLEESGGKMYVAYVGLCAFY